MENNLKYIVYLTTNLKNHKIYIGVHGTTTPEKFDGYIGNGVIVSHPSTYKKSKTAFQYAVNKYGIAAFNRDTIAIFDTLEEALKLEATLVNEAFVKRRDTYNMTTGGSLPPDGSIEIYQYNLDGTFVKMWKNAQEACQYFGVSNPTIRHACLHKHASRGYLWTDQYFEKLDPSQYETPKKEAYTHDVNNDFNKLTTVYLYNLDGTFFREFASPKECAEYFGDDKTSWLYKAARTGCKYHEYQVLREKVQCTKDISQKVYKRKVAQYDLDGHLVKVWESTQAAFKEYGSGVKKCVKGIQSKTKGYMFKYV